MALQGTQTCSACARAQKSESCALGFWYSTDKGHIPGGGRGREWNWWRHIFVESKGFGGCRMMPMREGRTLLLTCGWTPTLRLMRQANGDETKVLLSWLLLSSRSLYPRV